MKTKKIFFAIALLTSIATTTLFAQNIKVGNNAPDFTLKLSTGKTVKLADYKGKALLLHFWATWCPPCVGELPEMNKLAESLTDKSSLAFLAVCVSDTEKSMNNFIKKNKYTFTGGLDANNSVAISYGTQGIPMSVLISPQGKIEKIQVGAMTANQLEEFVSNYKK